MEKQTAVEWLVDTIKLKYDLDLYHVKKEIEQANQMFHNQIKDAVIYGLDEDGHTGDWKISVAENYYIKTYKK